MSTQTPSGKLSNTYTCTHFSKHHNTKEEAILSLSKRSKILSFIHTHRPIDERQRGAKECGRRSGRGEKDWKRDGDKGLRSAVRHTAGVRHRGPGSSALSLETAQMCQAPASERFPSLWPVDPSPAGGPPTNPSTAPSTLFSWHNPCEDGEGKRRHKSTCMKEKRARFSSSTNGIGKMTHHCEALLQIFFIHSEFSHSQTLFYQNVLLLHERSFLCVCVVNACVCPCCAEICLYWNSSVSWPTFLSWGAATEGRSDG